MHTSLCVCVCICEHVHMGMCVCVLNCVSVRICVNTHVHAYVLLKVHKCHGAHTEAEGNLGSVLTFHLVWDSVSCCLPSYMPG